MSNLALEDVRPHFNYMVTAIRATTRPCLHHSGKEEYRAGIVPMVDDATTATEATSTAGKGVL
jgi:hypothetical protein